MSRYWEFESGDYLNQTCYLISPEQYFEIPKSYFETASVVQEYRPLTFQAGYARKVFPDFFWHGCMTVVSDRFKSLLVSMDYVQAEFLPAKLLSKKGELVSGNPYWFMHLLEEIDCIDYTNSDIDFWNSKTRLIQRIRTLRFDETKIENRHLFRPRGCVIMFVSDQLKTSIEAENFIVDFKALEDVTLGA